MKTYLYKNTMNSNMAISDSLGNRIEVGPLEEFELDRKVDNNGIVLIKQEKNIKIKNKLMESE